ncbi:glycosyltransferase family 2 protein [Tuberibacillus sp. Marseille-P3662]|uniref:glycosyltransferase family 2 protein n=1 Tax=Tuberibacillus sp. Marseille-P3662 TaxID=1965358 RepID=UPI00111C606E|nr:glycosyltransferase family 2 protein [Tuberibacillus sp. Marseille-P3662]
MSTSSGYNDSSQPLVSIITPSYNSSDYIEEAISCVKNQTYENWEMIIVDDCSTDNSREIIQKQVSYDQRIRFIPLKENSGAAVARNNAISAANGRYIAFLDSDDLWMPQKLVEQVDFMERNDLAFTFTQYSVIDQNGEEVNEVINIPRVIDYKGLLKNTIIGCLTVMINIEKTGLVEMPNIRTRQDFALWLSILKRGFKAYGIQKKLAQYRVVKGSISSNKFKAAKRNWEIYREIENHGLMYSSWCFINYIFHAIKKRI